MNCNRDVARHSLHAVVLDTSNSKTNMDKEYLKEAAKAVNAKLPDNHGFILLVAPYGEGENNRLTYISSMTRETAIAALKEWLIKSSGEEEWMKHLK